MFFSINRERRLIGIFLLAVFLIVYNLGLYQLTKDVQFSFSDGRTMKWYALTPEGVKFYDRSGVEPVYGIQLKPVTPEVIRHLKLIEKGEFNPVDPEKATWFNPTTGDPQIWYYQSAGGSFEFFNKPGYHPLTGETLKPVNKEIHFEWLEKRKKGELRYSGTMGNNSELAQKPEKKRRGSEDPLVGSVWTVDCGGSIEFHQGGGITFIGSDGGKWTGNYTLISSSLSMKAQDKAGKTTDLKGEVQPNGRSIHVTWTDSKGGSGYFWLNRK